MFLTALNSNQSLAKSGWGLAMDAVTLFRRGEVIHQSYKYRGRKDLQMRWMAQVWRTYTRRHGQVILVTLLSFMSATKKDWKVDIFFYFKIKSCLSHVFLLPILHVSSSFSFSLSVFLSPSIYISLSIIFLSI